MNNIDTSTFTTIDLSDDKQQTKNKYTKKKIPKALDEQVWLKVCKRNFQHKCYISWCQNKITVFDYQTGHDIPESKGGETTLDNLYPICSRCNSSMSNKYTIAEFNKLGKGSKQKKVSTKCWFICC